MILSFLSSLLLASAYAAPAIDSLSSQSGPTAAIASPEPHRPPLREWTVMVYMNGKSNIEPFALADLNRFETVGSSEKVAIVAEIGRSKGLDNDTAADDGAAWPRQAGAALRVGDETTGRTKGSPLRRPAPFRRPGRHRYADPARAGAPETGGRRRGGLRPHNRDSSSRTSRWAGAAPAEYSSTRGLGIQIPGKPGRPYRILPGLCQAGLRKPPAGVLSSNTWKP